MSLAAKLSTDVLVTTLVKLSLKARGLVVIPLLTISLGASEYGAYVQVFAIATLLGQVTVLGMDTGVVQFIQQYDEDRAAMYWTIGAVLAATGAAGALGVALAAPLLGRYTLGTAAFTGVFLVGSVLVPLTIWFRFGQGYLQATRRIKWYSATDALAVYLHVASVAAVVFWTDWGIVGVLAAVVATRTLVVAGMHAAIVRELGVARPSLDRFRRYCSFSLPTTGTDVARSTLERADRVLVGAFLGAGAVGVYAVAYQVAHTVLLYVRPLSIALFPEFSRLWEDDRERVRDLTVSGLRYFLALAIPSVGGFWLIGEDLLHLLTTPAIATEAAPLLVVLAVGITFQAISEIYTELFYAADETRVPLRIQGGAAIGNVALNAALIPLLGIAGAALATVATFGLAAGTTVLAFQRWHPVVVPIRAVLAPVLATGIMVGVLWVAGLWWPITLVVAPAIYAVAFVAVGGVDRSELAVVLHEMTG